MKSTVYKAVIPVAGFGTRFLPFTKAIPKEMLPIVDRPSIQYIVEEAVESGIREILLITSRSKKAIEDHFDKAYELEDLLKRFNKISELKIVGMHHIETELTYMRQKEMKGSGHAVGLARNFVGDKPFAVLFGDDVIYNPDYPCTKQLIDAYNKTMTCIVGVQAVSDEVAHRCGVVKKGAIKGRYTEVKELIEKPPVGSTLPSNLASLGRFVLTPDIFDVLERTPLMNNEIFLTEAINIISKESSVYAYEFEGIRYDLGNKLGFLTANIEFGLRDKSIGQPLRDYLKNRR